jgi:hypothetical protein
MSRFMRVAVFGGATFCAALCVQTFLEWTGRADSLGLWYTVYAALVYTIIILGLIALGSVVLRKIRPKDSDFKSL